MDETLSRSNGHPQAAQTVSAKNPKAAAAMANDMNIVRRKLTGYVGFANLPNQWHRKSVRKGFNFNVMVVGTCPQLRGSRRSTNASVQASLGSENRP
jgi:septin 7